MRKSIILILLLAFSSSLIAQLETAMTFNIRYDNPHDHHNNWHLRKAELVDLIKYYSPDVLSVQEALSQQVDYLDSALTDYSYLGVGRDDGKRKGEFSAIFYNKKQFKVLESGNFWLSETPEKASFGWDAACIRICTYGLLKNTLNNKKTWVFNTHFDHEGKKARIESMNLIISKIKELTNSDNYPIILTGDFNMSPEHESIKKIQNFMQDSYKVSKIKHYGPMGTFNGFDLLKKLNYRIDYIFVKGCKVLKHRHIEDRRENNLRLSDHLPVMVEFMK